MDEPVEHHSNEPIVKAGKWVFRSTLLIAICYAVAMGILYELRPDDLLALTVFPVWVWTIPPILIVLLIGLLAGYRYLLALIPLLLVTYLASDTPLAPLRVMISDAPPTVRQTNEQTLRVISHNCHHLPSAVKALKKYDADIVLLQEIVRSKHFEEVRLHLFGEAGFSLKGRDIAILSRYPLKQITLENEYQKFCIAAQVSIPTSHGTEDILLAPLHLNSPPFRYDLWEKECWQSYTQHRLAQKKQFQSIVNSLPAFEANDKVIIGGDFNAPAGDVIFEIMPSYMQEAFHETGVGWGCSFHSQYPLIRIDQLWSTPQIKPIRCHTVDSESSDHRVIIVDYEIIPDLFQQ